MYMRKPFDFCHVKCFGWKYVPAKYSCPGKPVSSGEQTTACQTSKFIPSQTAWSNEGFKLSEKDSRQCMPILVNPSAATIFRLFVCAAEAGCLVKNRLSSPTRWRGDQHQNSDIGIFERPKSCSESIGAPCGPPDSG